MGIEKIIGDGSELWRRKIKNREQISFSTGNTSEVSSIGELKSSVSVGAMSTIEQDTRSHKSEFLKKFQESLNIHEREEKGITGKMILLYDIFEQLGEDLLVGFDIYKGHDILKCRKLEWVLDYCGELEITSFDDERLNPEGLCRWIIEKNIDNLQEKYSSNSPDSVLSLKVMLFHTM